MELFSLFIAGTFWFWFMIFVVSCIVCTALEYESGAWATITLLAMLVLLHFAGNNIVGYVRENPWTIFTYIFLYFVSGTLWSFVKGWAFFSNIRESYNEYKEDFLQNHGQDPHGSIPDGMLTSWRETAGQYDGYKFQKIVAGNGRLRIRDYKAKFLLWMTYWPWSLMWTLISDFVKRVFKQIWNRIQILYQRMADYVFRGVEEDFRPAPKADNTEKADNTAVDYHTRRRV